MKCVLQIEQKTSKYKKSWTSFYLLQDQEYNEAIPLPLKTLNLSITSSKVQEHI